jgi:hypothetical protein
MIWNMGHVKAIEILIQYGYTLDQLIIPLVDEVTVLSPFGTESLVCRLRIYTHFWTLMTI